MIKVNKYEVELQGDVPKLLTETTMLCMALKDTIVDDDMSEESAKEMILKCVELAFMSDDEFYKAKMKAMEEAKSKLLDILMKGMGE